MIDDGDTVRRVDAPSDGTLTNVDPLRPEDRVRDGTADSTFKTGEVLASRYRVERFIAKGGMGEVYEVFDQELGEHVALKTILPRTADDPASLDRFRRETQLARKVSHPNVCRIFDIGRHARPDGGETVFLTMELLDGVSLRTRLIEGPMTPDEAQAVVEQLAAGLGVAHRRGIVHRDLKPSNIFLVKDGDAVRVVIADFGLARSQVPDATQATVTVSGEILGTPAYMSPEQIEGRPATTASDIYAVGLIMYEMLTGVRAFEGDSAFQMALAKLRDTPTSPSKRSPGIPPRWDRTILRCLEKNPADRLPNVEQIPAILRGDRALPRGRWQRRLRGRPAVWGTVSLAVVAVAFAAMVKLDLLPIAFGPRPAPTAPELRRSVAVLGFQNATGDPDRAWISTALADYLTTELASGGSVRAIPGESVALARSELEVGQSTSLGAETLDRLRRRLAADLVVLGSFTVLGSDSDATLRLDCRVQDTATGETTVLNPVTGPLAELFEIAGTAASDIRTRLGLGVAATAVASTALPSDPVAARLYAEGVARLRSFDPAGARDRLERAAKADPSSPLVWLELANAWTELGYGVNALAAAQRANELSADLDRETRLRIAGRYQLLANRLNEAVDSYRSLWLVYPDNLEYGLRLAEAQLAAGKVEEAQETVAELKRLPDPLGNDPRIDLIDADVAERQGDSTRRADEARRVIEASQRIGSSLLEAEARLKLGGALRAGGQFQAAQTEIEAARALEQAAGNRAGEAGAAYALSLVHLALGDLEAGTKEAEASLAMAREVGSRTLEGDALNLIGSIRVHQGDFAGALEVFREALELQREISNAGGEADAFNNLALVQMWSGDFRAAIDSFTQVRALYQQLGKRQGEAAVVMNMARIDAARGDLDGGRRLFEEAAGLYRVQGNDELLAEALFGLGEVLLTQGDLEGARARHLEALGLRRKLELGSVVESEFALAGLALTEANLGRLSYDEVVSALTTTVAALADSDRRALETDALNYLAEAQLGAGDVDGAEATLQRIRDQADAANSVTMMVLRINEARVESHRGRNDEATATLESVIEDARTGASLGVELEARLVLAEVLARAGRTREAVQRLRNLRQDATGRGWILVADRAATIEDRLANAGG